jgi:two-component system, chemotaxis family, sensor kinase Cph1
MIASLFDFSRVGRLELGLDDVPLAEVIDDALERLAVAPGRDRVEVRVPRPLPTVRADRERVTELFFNLLSNALKYSDKPDAWVEVSYARPGEPGADGLDVPVFRVRDNGIGIEPRHHDAVWRLYKRLHPRDAYGGGTGAGLTIVRRIVERHGGRVWLDSVPGEGTTVSFTLGPAWRGAAEGNGDTV